MARAPAPEEQDGRPRDADRIEGAAHPRETVRLRGHEAPERAFIEAWYGGRTHHAWLLRGPRGVGKATFAYRVARFLLSFPEESASGGLFGEADAPEPVADLDISPDHPDARRIAAGAHPRLVELRRPWDEKTKRFKKEIGVDQVRRLIEFLQLSAADGGWRAVIVDPADELNAAAANALLKALEEPPAKTVFLLVAHAAGRLPSTIRSRCRRLDFRPLSESDCATALRAACAEISQADAARLSVLAGGAPGEALTLWSMGGAEIYAETLALLGDLPRIDRGRLNALIRSVSGRENAERFPATGRLLRLAAERIARAGVEGAPPSEAAPGELEILRRLAPDAAAARRWAALASDIDDRFGAAIGLNLDPGRTMVDLALHLEAATARQG